MPTSISALANETLCEIFQHLLDPLTVDEWYQQTLPSIRLVSRHWNTVIETLPMLWTSVLITEKSANQFHRSPFQSTRLRLSRSLELPLKIYINLQISPEINCFNNSDAIILGQMIRVVAPRVTCIDLRANSYSRTIQMIILSSLNSTPMPLLHRFVHIDPNTQPKLDDDGYFQNPSSILQYQGRPETRRVITEWGRDLYPSLTDIHLSGVSYNIEHLAIMPGIRRLRIVAQPSHQRPSINQMLDILSPARDTLEILLLEDVINKTPTDTSSRSKPIIFKKLKLFSLGYHDAYIAKMFLESVRLPALVNLTLTFTLTPCYTDQHICIPLILTRYFPLSQVKSLTLINVMFPPEGIYNVGIAPHRGHEMSDAEHASFVEMVKFHGFTHSSGHWKIPLFMYFLTKFRSLRHFHLYDTVGLTNTMSAHWVRGTLPRLQRLHLDGCPEGVYELARAVGDLRKEGNRPLPLCISFSEKLKSQMSEEEKTRLYPHFRALTELYTGKTCKPDPPLNWDCQLSLL